MLPSSSFRHLGVPRLVHLFCFLVMLLLSELSEATEKKVSLGVLAQNTTKWCFAFVAVVSSLLCLPASSRSPTRKQKCFFRKTARTSAVSPSANASHTHKRASREILSFFSSSVHWVLGFVVVRRDGEEEEVVRSQREFLLRLCYAQRFSSTKLHYFRVKLLTLFIRVDCKQISESERPSAERPNGFGVEGEEKKVDCENWWMESAIDIPILVPSFFLFPLRTRSLPHSEALCLFNQMRLCVVF